MKSKDKEPVRRSSRRTKHEESSTSVREESSAVKSKTPPAKSPRGRKRKNSVPPEEMQPTIVSPKIQKKTIEGREIDGFCWMCHKLGQDLICNSCPRVYHTDCVHKSQHLQFNASGCCGECQAQSLTRGLDPSKITRQRLRELLKLAMQEALKEEVKKSSLKTQSKPVENPKFCKYFKTWTQEGNTDLLCQIIDLDILIDKINDDSPYLTCAEFFSDVKWIYHNCFVLHGPDSEMTEAALKLEKNFKQELLDIEGCEQCYFIKHSDEYMHADFFTKVCKEPHDIIWAKLRGSPYWPAKCLKIYNGHADVRFFGTHDKSVIPLSHCFRISQRSPNDKEIRQCKYQDAITELSIYVSNYRSAYGQFPYYTVRTPLQFKNQKKTNKRGRQRRSNSDNKFLNDSHLSENDSDAEEPSRPFPELGSVVDGSSNSVEAVFQTKLETPLSHDMSCLDSMEFPSGEKHLTVKNAISSAEPVAVCMTFVADEEVGPLHPTHDHSRLMDTSTPLPTPHSFSDTLLTCPPHEGGSDFVMDAETLRQSHTPPFVNSNASNMLPVITSAVSEDVKNPSDFPTEPSGCFSMENGIASTEAFMQNLSSMMRNQPGASGNLPTVADFEKDFTPTDDEVMVIGEKNVEMQSVKEILENSSLVYGLCQVISSNRPHLQDLFKKCLDFGLNTFLQLWLTTSIKKSDDNAAMTFVHLCKKLNEEKKCLMKEKEVVEQENRSLRQEMEKLRVQSKGSDVRCNVAIERQQNARKIINVLSAKASNDSKKGGPAAKKEDAKTFEEAVATLEVRIQDLKDGITERDERHRVDEERMGLLLDELESRKCSVVSVEVQTYLSDSPDNEMFTLRDIQELHCDKISGDENSSDGQDMMESEDDSTSHYVETGEKMTLTRSAESVSGIAYVDEEVINFMNHAAADPSTFGGANLMMQDSHSPVFLSSIPEAMNLSTAGSSLPMARNMTRSLSRHPHAYLPKK